MSQYVKWSDKNKEFYEEIIGDQCPRVLLSVGEATKLAQKLSIHVNQLLMELDAEYERGREDEAQGWHNLLEESGLEIKITTIKDIVSSEDKVLDDLGGNTPIGTGRFRNSK